MANLRAAIAATVLILGFLSGCASTSSIQIPDTPWAKVVTSETVPLVGSFKVHRYLLGNGLRLLVVEDHSSPTFAYQTWYSVGSRDEIPGKTGLAHLFEHLMFKATTHHPEGEFDRILEAAGVENENAFTTWDYTAFVQQLPVRKGQNLDLIANLESDRMVNLVVNDQSFKTERDVVQNERRYRNENSPDGTIFQNLYGTAFTVHPYHWPVIGYEKDLNEMTVKDPMNFYHAYYSPNHATVIVVGDVHPETVLKTIQHYYGNIPPQHAPEHTIPVEPPQTSSRHRTVALNIQVEKLEMGYKVPDVRSSDIPALDVLDAVLTGGKAARLQRDLVDTGIAQSIGTGVMEAKDPSLFIFDCTLQQGKKAATAESVILRVLRHLSRQPISAAELARAKNRIEFSFYQGLGDSEGKANFLGRYSAMTGSFERGLEIQQDTLKVTPEQLQAVVQKYFVPGNRTAITGVMK